jgi:hypothetical protein
VTGDFRDRTGPNSLRLPSAPSVEPEVGGYQPYAVENYFGELVQTLTFRLKDGSQFAKPYHWLGEIEFDPSTGIRLRFSDTTITLSGRNLAPLFTLLCDYKVRWVLEADRPTALLVPESGTVIEAIERGAEKLAS